LLSRRVGWGLRPACMPTLCAGSATQRDPARPSAGCAGGSILTFVYLYETDPPLFPFPQPIPSIGWVQKLSKHRFDTLGRLGFKNGINFLLYRADRNAHFCVYGYCVFYVFTTCPSAFFLLPFCPRKSRRSRKMAPRWAQMGSRWRQDGGKMAQDGALSPSELNTN